jgi:thiamine biosynthesis lipoprotein
MRKKISRKIIFLTTIYYLLSTALCGCENKTLHKDTQVMMGTFVEVISPHKNAANIVFGEIKRIENLLSKYKEDSEIAKLNRLGQLKVSQDTFYVLKKAEEFWKLSNGAFDITVGPLADLWGFTEKKYSVPEEERIKNVLELVGTDKIIFHSQDNVVKFKVRGMQIDLGAIAKGYAVDCAVKKLKEQGIKSCLINAGGQIHCLGDRSGKPWKVAVKSPRGEDFIDYLELKDRSVTTSGDYEQYFTKGNKRYAHILNPKTGYPANSGIVSVTVIAPSGLTADALSTSIFVLGKDKGMELAKKFKDVEVKIIEEDQI